jgi:hypothetical protein
VEGPACESVKTQGLLIKTARAAPWILDPTADDACACRGPRRAPKARVHVGPAVQNEGVCDLGRPREIERPRTHASEGRRRRRRAAARDRGSPALALDSVPGHHLDHEQVQNDAGTLARVTGGLWGQLCLTGGQHRKGAERPLRRARGCTVVHERKGKRVGIIAHSSKEKRASSKVKKIRRRRSLATAAGRAVLRCGRGAAPTGSGDENLQPIELDEPLVNPK